MAAQRGEVCAWGSGQRYDEAKKACFHGDPPKRLRARVVFNA
jgi:hypothetical protein